jgi:hypothetical protein
VPYTAERPPAAASPEELRARIPGWGVDLDPADRPSFPRERFDPGATGAHWDMPEQQPETWRRERSVEHRRLTPVFGTSCPPRGLSGRLRRQAYELSEARTRHWLLLMAADRVDAMESHARALVSGRPDNPIAEAGLTSWRMVKEGARPPGSERRADARHRPADPVLVFGPWVLSAWMATRVVRKVRRR